MAKSNKIETSKKILFLLLLLVLCLPILQMKTKFAKVKQLNGAIAEPVYPTFNYDSLEKGVFQEKFEKYFNEDVGFRPSFIRLNNQLKYWLYNKAQANGVLIGKEGYLYEYNYIKAYYGLNYIGKDSIENNVKRLKYIQDKLASMNKTLIIVLAPGKGSFYPEYFPDSCNRKIGPTNTQFYIKYLKKHQVNFVDLKTWFLKIKKSSKYPLYSKGGIHWSKYGEVIAFDTLVKFIESKTNLDFPNISITSVKISDEKKDGDNDIGDGMNLIFRNPSFPMGYPEIVITQPEMSVNKTSFISDSYYWGAFNRGFSTSIFGNGKFWFYNNEVYPDNYEKPTTVNDLNFSQEINENKVIVLMSTDANLDRFPFGFIELFMKYFPPR